MSYAIEDYSRTFIYITDGFREYFVPKFRLSMEVNEPYLTLKWNIPETGGNNRVVTIDYQTVSNYGYSANPTSAQDLKDILEGYIDSAWTDINTGDLLSAKADLLSHNGVTDTILPAGANESILSRDNSEATGLKWIPKSTVVSGLTSAIIIPTITGATSAMTNAATYYWGSSGAFGANTNQGLTRIYNLTGKTLTIVAISTFIRWTVGTSETSTVYLRYNNTTDYSLGTVAGNVAQTELSLTGQSIAWTSGDYVEMKMVNPTWVTRPSGMSAGGQIHCLSPIS
jgi:hypothetical protein